MRNYLYRLGLLIIFVISFHNALWAETPSSTSKFITIADIHFTPYSSCHLGQPCLCLNKLRKANYTEWRTILEQCDDSTLATAFHDTNYVLFDRLQIALQDIRKKENLKFVILLGDFLAHDFHKQYIKYSGDRTRAGYQSFVKKTYQFMAQEFLNTFPDIDVYSVIGNNDSYTGDYSMIPGGQFLQDITPIWAKLIRDDENRQHFVREFPKAGYYKITLPQNRHLHIIVLNTVLFSSYKSLQKVKQTALSQLNWLQNELDLINTNEQKVMLAYHIPAGIDLLGTMKHFGKITSFWDPQFTQRFEELLKKYAPSISEILAAHIHIDTLQFMTLETLANIEVTITPSISPIYGNNPGFKLFSYDTSTFDIKDVDTFVLMFEPHSTMKQWKRADST